MQETQGSKRRFRTILVVILFLLMGAVAVGTLFTQSLTTRDQADQAHDHDGDGTPDH